MYMNELWAFIFFGKEHLDEQEEEVGILFHGLRWRRYQGHIGGLSCLVLLCRLYTAQLQEAPFTL